MTVQDRERAEEEALLALIREAAQQVPIEGDRAGRADATGGNAVRLPTPSALIRDGRRVRARRRIVTGTASLAACALIAAGGVAVGTGSLRLPGLGRGADGAQPATLEASRGSKVGDVVNAIDTGFGGPFGGDTAELRTLRYRAKANAPTLAYGGSDSAADRLAALRESGVDRGVEVRWAGRAGGDVELRLVKTRPGTMDLVESHPIPALDLGADGRGRWLRVRPSAEDGWLVLAVLPHDADAVQVRVAGTDVVLPVDRVPVDETCIRRSDSDDYCVLDSPSPGLALRFATTAEAPPIDAITYVDGDGRYVVLDEKSARTIVE